MTISKLSGSFSRGPPPPGVLQAMQRVHTPLNTKIYLEVCLRSRMCPLAPSYVPFTNAPDLCN